MENALKDLLELLLQHIFLAYQGLVRLEHVQPIDGRSCAEPRIYHIDKCKDNLYNPHTEGPL
jgi:hypothetical protein